MKRIIILSAAVFALSSFSIEARGHNYYVGDYFYTELAPYGRWIEIDYGVVVWQPTVMRVSWLPYRVGRWVWTYDGWYWDSYEPFGYITYHYGRWYYDDYYGWLWYPDYEWAPAWVEWRYSNDYIGWAPLHPYATFSISFGIRFTQVYYTPYYHWHFVTFKHFHDPYVYNYCVNNDYRYRIYNDTHYRTNYSYSNGRVQNRGVDFNYIKVRSGQDIRQRDIIRVQDKRDLSRNGDENQIRTLDLKKETLLQNNLKRMEIQKDNRKTSLDLTKVEVGNRKLTTTSLNKTNDIKQDNRSSVTIRNDNKTKDVRNDVRTNDKNRIDNKVIITDGKQKTDVRKEVDTRINEQVKIQTDRTIVDKKQNKKFEQNTKKEQIRINTESRNNRTEVKIKQNNSNDKMNVTKNREQDKRNDNNTGIRNENKVQTNRTMVKDKSRERSRG